MVSQEARVYTEDEIREKFLKHIWLLIQYWECLSKREDVREKLEGLAFSILSMIDGSTYELPAFVLAPMPHPEDKAYHQQRNENWFPQNHEADINCDIAGGLHELFHRYDPEK